MSHKKKVLFCTMGRVGGASKMVITIPLSLSLLWRRSIMARKAAIAMIVKIVFVVFFIITPYPLSIVFSPKIPVGLNNSIMINSTKVNASLNVE